MVDFNNIKLRTSRELSMYIVELFDIDIISFDNAILYGVNTDEYCKSTNRPKISCGLTLYRNQYYFFEQCLTDRVSAYGLNTYSYYVYCVRSETAKKMIETKVYNLWMLKFESMYYHCGFYKMLDYYSDERYFYESKIEDDIMFIPYGTSPYGMKEDITISEYFCGWHKEYKDSELIINNSLLRSIKLKKLDMVLSRL